MSKEDGEPGVAGGRKTNLPSFRNNLAESEANKEKWSDKSTSETKSYDQPGLNFILKLV